MVVGRGLLLALRFCRAFGPASRDPSVRWDDDGAAIAIGEKQLGSSDEMASTRIADIIEAGVVAHQDQNLNTVPR